MASVNVTAPTSSTSVQAGQNLSITWTASVDETMETITGFVLELYNGNSLDTTILNTNNGNLRSYTYTVPSNQSPDTDYRIKVTMNYEEFE